MTYSIYAVFGDYFRGKYITGGFKTVGNAKERCVKMMNHLSRHAKAKLVIVDNKTKKSVGWVRNGWAGETGIFWEDTNDKVTLIMR